ncbi:4-hydroxy-3-methylbut-2-en-1-yl diphosphate synthase (ferredoxin), chloroplastic [Iris pallida]|uniref:4-hydroxy-3-methylbut-2-en-1-yl diphosphate synthase (Ferredoxin), chloroplastic n=1 Tax=Iris pallida TaxID=29817 RepID=A0AAX6H8S2_IRIPA|nr:4-hydroxy-3-methylbut-2-en-1-yl diphosphate synthase (ferredoxin), chloroplastic [Iris pallida]
MYALYSVQIKPHRNIRSRWRQDKAGYRQHCNWFVSQRDDEWDFLSFLLWQSLWLVCHSRIWQYRLDSSKRASCIRRYDAI